jgi:DNA-binding response OmpR family regulator
MSGSVLIVDDDDMTSALVAEVLSDEGFTVTHLGTRHQTRSGRQ